MRLFASFAFFMAVACLASSLIVNLGFYVNDDFVSDQVKGPHPFAATVAGTLLVVGVLVIPLAMLISFFASLLSPFRAPRGVNLAAALLGLILSSMAWGIQAGALERIRANPARFRARGISKLSEVIQQYAQSHDGRLPPCENWCGALIALAPDSAAHLAYPMMSGAPVNSSTLGLNANVGGMDLTKLPGDTVLLFGTHLAVNPVGDQKRIATDSYDGRGTIVVFADFHVEFVETQDFNDLRWVP
ncbi:MAG: hypothetical protein JW741_13360 [Sedimentisphaerales bacterium]|nr:hypothetical protein [Sedimentisphaerales bacterium]